MRIELEVQVRGGRRVVVWDDGDLSGDDEVLRRLSSLVEAGRVDRQDLLSVVRGVEEVCAQQAVLANLDWTDPVGPGGATALAS